MVWITVLTSCKTLRNLIRFWPNLETSTSQVPRRHQLPVALEPRLSVSPTRLPTLPTRQAPLVRLHPVAPAFFLPVLVPPLSLIPFRLASWAFSLSSALHLPKKATANESPQQGRPIFYGSRLDRFMDYCYIFDIQNFLNSGFFVILSKLITDLDYSNVVCWTPVLVYPSSIKQVD